MIRSMTGFGAASAPLADGRIDVEVKSVNHRHCDVRVRLPGPLSALESKVATLVKERVARGHVEVTVKADGTALAPKPRVDRLLARAYADAYAQLAEAAGIDARVALEPLAAAPGVVRLEDAGPDLDIAAAALDGAVARALDGLDAMRLVEGEALSKDLAKYGAIVREVAKRIDVAVPRMVEAHRARLAKRLEELLGPDNAIDPMRLAQEVAMLAERTDIAEELARLDSHLAQLDALLVSREPAGRKLDFLLQEMNREVNTIGSKCQSADIARDVVDLKATLERLREQVQNIE